jgi:hypothetical protein
MEEIQLFRVILRLRGTENFFKLGRKTFLQKIIYNPFIFAKISFSKIRLLTVTGMAICVHVGPKRQNLFCLV